MLLTLAEGLLFLALIAAPLLYGSVHFLSLIFLAFLGVLTFNMVGMVRPESFARALRTPWTWLGIAIGAVILTQFIPMPVEWIRKISPETYRFYELYFPGGVKPGSYFTLSVCPGETVRGLIQFLTYGLFFLSVWMCLASVPAAPAAEVHPVSWKKSEFLKLGCLTGILALLFHSIYDFNLHISANGIYFVTLLALGAGASDRVYDHAFFRRVVDFFITFGFLVALFAILQKFSHNGRIFWVGMKASKPVGPYFNYDHYAGFMEMCSAVAVGKVVASFFHTSFAHCKGLAQKIFWFSTREAHQALRCLLMSAVMIATIFMSTSRGGIMSFALSQIFFFSVFLWTAGRQRKGKRWAGVVTAGMLFVGVMVLWLGPETLLKKIHMTSVEKIIKMESSDSIRIHFYKGTLLVIRDFPVIGTGLGTFGTNFTRYRSFKYFGGPTNYLRRTHNDYLELVSETGIAGVLFLLGFLILYLRAVILVVRKLE
ncbi:MAG: O-antigen ligase family protein [Candidatus Omnitrophota bacterium]